MLTARLVYKNSASSTEFNLTRSQIIERGIYSGGTIGNSPTSFNITIAPFVASSYDGMVITSDVTETLTITDGRINYVVLYVKYQERTAPVLQLAVLDSATWSTSTDKNYFITFAKIDLTGSHSGVPTVTITYSDSDYSDKLGKSPIRQSVATLAALPLTQNKVGDIRVTNDTHALYMWDGTTWIVLLIVTASDIPYAGGSAWADGTTNPATTVEGQLDKVITDLTSTTGTRGLGKFTAPSLASWADSTTNPAINADAALNKVITDLTSVASATCGASKIASYRHLANGMTFPDGTVYDFLTTLVDYANVQRQSNMLNFNFCDVTDTPSAISASALIYGAGGWVLADSVGNIKWSHDGVHYSLIGNKAGAVFTSGYYDTNSGNYVLVETHSSTSNVYITTTPRVNASWITHAIVVGAENYYIFDVCQFLTGCIAVGRNMSSSGNQVILTTTNFITWTVRLEIPFSLAYFHAVASPTNTSSSLYVVVGDNGSVYTSSNPDVTWTNLPSGTIHNLRDVDIDLDGTIWVVGDFETIRKYQGGVWTAVTGLDTSSDAGTGTFEKIRCRRTMVDTLIIGGKVTYAGVVNDVAISFERSKSPSISDSKHKVVILPKKLTTGSTTGRIITAIEVDEAGNWVLITSPSGGSTEVISVYYSNSVFPYVTV